MSDVMLLGVLRMPMPDDPDPMTLRQFVSRARQAACRIEADTDELEELRANCAALLAELDEARRDAELLRSLLAMRAAGALLYDDDGELQDNTQMPYIDFKRDAPGEIHRKLRERGLANYRRCLADEVAAMKGKP